MDHARHEDVERARVLVERADNAALDALLADLHPADIAEMFGELDNVEQIAILKRLDTERAAEVLTEIDQHSGQTLLILLSDREVVSLLARMRSDDAADFVSTLPAGRSRRLERLLSTEDRSQLAELRGFDEESAGGIMEIERVAVLESAIIQDAIDIVREDAEVVENVQKIYVVHKNGELAGAIHLLDLIVHPPRTPVREIMDVNLVTVPVDMDQEEVAALFGKYDEFTLPVVDAANRLVGRITVDDIIDVMEEEASEDIAHIAGTVDVEIGNPSILHVSRSRLPWLVTAMLGEVLTALVMSHHEATLQTLVVLAFFVPLIVATAGNVGIQASVVVVREIALGHIGLRHIGRRVLKELSVALVNGLILGVVLFVIATAWRREVGLGILLCASLLCVVLVAAFMGASLPLLLNRWRIDPAIATGPFVTVSNDVIGLTIYLSLAHAYVMRFH